MNTVLGFRWERCAGGARLLRVYGDVPCPVLPGKIDGLPLVEIGAYCFAEKERPGGTFWPEGSGGHAICGNFVTDITLPDSVRVLDSAAFYNCRGLKTLTAGANVTSLGSDLFTNCRALEWFVVRSAPDSPTGLRKLLGAVSADVSVRFADEAGRVTASLFYPEYFEWLDENTPAHIFNHSIEGEGYRYRQCFRSEVLDYAEYDSAFVQAAVGEPPAKLCRIALGRLLFPFGLDGTAAARYRAFLAEHLTDAAALAAAARDTAAFRLLCGLEAAAPLRARLAAICSDIGWSEGAALALAGGARKRKSYDFDDL